MMEKEDKPFVLEENIRYLEWTKNISDKDGQFIHVEHVKEFIRLLKEDVREGSIIGHDIWFIKIIDKRAGQRLVGDKE